MQPAGVSLTSPRDPNRGLGLKQVLIRSIDTGTDTVYATDAGGAEIQLPWRIRRVGVTPAIGQTWLIDRQLGFWSLAAYVYSADGAWTAPTGCYAPPDQDQSASTSQALSATPWAFPTGEFTFDNPSPVWPVRVEALTHAQMTVDTAAASAAYLSTSPQFVGGDGTRGATTHVSNPTAGPATGLKLSVWNAVQVVVGAGGTARLDTPTTATLVGGTVTLTAWAMRVKLRAWLLDPTQPGGVA